MSSFDSSYGLHPSDVGDPDMWKVFSAVCTKYGRRDAYRVFTSGPLITYRDFYSRVTTLASRLKQVLEYAGVTLSGTVDPRSQPKVAALLPNCPQYLELFWANAGLRVVTATLNTRLSGAEISGVMASTPCAVLVCSTDFQGLVESLDFEACGIETVVWVAPHTLEPDAQATVEDSAVADGVVNVSYSVLMRDADEVGSFDPPPFASADLGLQLFFTSGTTGKPKAIVHTHRNIFTWSRLSLQALGMTGEQMHCCGHFMPMFHVADNAFVWSLTMIGARHVFPLTVTDVMSVLRVLSEEKISVVKFAPTTITIAAGFGKKTFDKLDLSKLTWIWSGGAALADELRQRAEEKFKCEIICGYGMTESTGPVAMSRFGRPGYQVIPGVELQVQNGEGGQCARNETGEIMVRGDTLFKGYLNVPVEDNKKAFTKNGWFHSGDMGVIDSDGMLHVTGRIKDMIIVAGENVYAAEVEAVIASMPEVKQVAVFGWPDHMLGEVVEAGVVFKEDMEPLRPNQIIAQCRSKLADFKVPKRVHILQPGEMPVTGIGKPVKADLKKLIERREATAEKEEAKDQLHSMKSTGSITRRRSSLKPATLPSRKSGPLVLASSIKLASSLPGAMSSATAAEAMLKVLKREFGLEVGPADGLFDAGLTSMQAVELLSAFESALGCQLPGSLLFEYPSIAEIEEYLVEENLLGRYARAAATAGTAAALTAVASNVQQRLTRNLSRASVFDVRFDVKDKEDVLGLVKDEEAAKDMGDLDEPLPSEDSAQQGPRQKLKRRSPAFNQNNPLVLLLQLLGLLVRPMLAGGLFFLPLIIAFEQFYIRWGIGYAILAGPAILHGAFALLMVSAAMTKWLLLGRVRQGVHPLWGWFYIRWLVVHNYSRWLFAWAGIYRSTPLYTFYYRLFGLKVGRNVIIDSQWITDCDLVTIGDETIVSRDCNLQPSQLRDGMLILREVKIGKQCLLNHGSMVLGGGVVPDRATLYHLEVVDMPLRRKADVEPERVPLPMEVSLWRKVYRKPLYRAMQLAGLLYLGYLITVVGTIGAYYLSVFWHHAGKPSEAPTLNPGLLTDEKYFWSLFWTTFMLPTALYIILPYSYFVAVFVSKWTIIGSFHAFDRHQPPNVHDMWRRWLMVRMTDWWWFATLQRTTVMSEVNATLYRLLGAKIGKRVYFNSPYIVEYDLLEVDDDCMVAWDIAMLPNRLDRTRTIRFEKGACCANNVVLCDGANLGPNCLVGDCAYGPSAFKFPPGTLWTSKPRPVCVGRTTVPPPPTNMSAYWFWQAMLACWQLLMPSLGSLPGAVTVAWTKREINKACRLAGLSLTTRVFTSFIVPVPIYIMEYLICLLLTLCVAKWIFLGRFKPCRTPKFVSYTYVSWVALDSIIFDLESSYLNDLRGTAFLPWFMCMMGAKVGRNVCMLSITGGVEFDLKRFDDNVCLNYNAKPLSHSIQEHMLSYSYVTFLQDVTVGTRAIVEMDAVVPAGSNIPPLSAVHAIRDPVVTNTELFPVPPPVAELPHGPQLPGSVVVHLVKRARDGVYFVR